MQNATLNTTNPDYLLYQYEQIHFEVLGGIKLDVLNNMRATVKVKHFNAEQRHTLDLYNNNALQRFLKTTAESLEVGIQYMQKATGSLINELEAYRLKEIEKAKLNTIVTKVLSEQEVRAAQAFLEQPNLLKETNNLLGKSGIIGEETNKVCMDGLVH